VGKLGELLVQYKLLQQDVASAHMTADSGIDLVVYFSKSNKATTIQVKVNPVYLPCAIQCCAGMENETEGLIYETRSKP
jgi:hypothetical protein